MELALLLFIATGCFLACSQEPPEIEVLGSVTRIFGANGSNWAVQPGRTVKLSCKHSTEDVEWMYNKTIHPVPKESLLHSLQGLLLQYEEIHPNNSGSHVCQLKGNHDIQSAIYLNVTDIIPWRRGSMVMPSVGYYKMDTNWRTWSDAQGWCQAQDSHLAVPDTPQELDAFPAMAASADIDRMWMGVKRTGVWATADGSLLNISNIANWNPEELYGRGGCVFWVSGKLLADECDNTRKFICQQIQVNATCLPNYTEVTGVGCVQFIDSGLMWEEAQQHCQAAGGHLAVPASIQKLNTSPEFTEQLEIELWVGIHRIKKEWTTELGQPLAELYTHQWKPDSSDNQGDCLILEDAVLVAEECDSRKPSICELDQDWIASQDAPKITVEGLTVTRIHRNNSTEWGVQPGRRVTITCEATYGFVEWEYRQNGSSPVVVTHLWSDAEGKQVIYESVQPNNTGDYRCYLREDPNISSHIYLHVSLNYSSPEGYSLLPGLGSYKIPNLQQTWTEARQHCEAQGSHLWVPKSQQEVAAIQEMSNLEGEYSPLWVGVRRTYIWTTIHGEPFEKVSFINLTLSETTNGCINLRSDELEDEECNEQLAVICELMSVNSTCQNGDVQFDGDICYKVNDTEMTWDEAQQYCEGMGASLAIPKSLQEMHMLKKLNEPMNSWPWIGIYKVVTGWSSAKDEQPWIPNITNWTPSESKDVSDCIAFDETGLYNKDCDIMQGFVCGRNDGTIGTAPLPRIVVERDFLTRILGTNSKVWGTEPGNSITLRCTSLHGFVMWRYPLVEEQIQPNQMRIILEDMEGQSLIYASIHTNNTGDHSCFSISNTSLNYTVRLLVSKEYTNTRNYDLLPGVGYFKLINDELSWNEARSRCEAEDADLVVPTALEELKALQEMADYAEVQSNLWVGVRRTGEWAAVRDNKLVRKRFVDWEQRKAEGNGGCIALSDGVLQDASCTDSKSFICNYISGNSTCPTGFIPVPPSNCLRLNKTKVTWKQAQKSCESLELSLVVPESRQMLTMLNKLSDLIYDGTWVGIYRPNETWTAYQGSQERYTKASWILGELDEGGGDCVVLIGDELSTEHCTSENKFICQIKERKSKTPKSLEWLMILSITVLGVAAAILIPFSIVLSYRLHQQRVLRNNLLQGDESDQNCLVDQVPLLPFSDRWEFPANQLDLGELLGAGEFGVVRMAQARFIAPGKTVSTVAVKTVNKGADMACIKALVLEMKILSHLGHHINVVNLLGACTKGLGRGKLKIIVEYCRYGNLQTYLVNHRNHFVDQLDPETGKLHLAPNPLVDISIEPDNSSRTDHHHSAESQDTSQTLWLAGTSLDAGPLTTRDLMSWAYQVAKGMDYLTSRKVMHGDLAARNVLLADNNVVKICDFGLARNLAYSSYYKKKEDDLLPIKWMSPEALSDQVFSPQSDVWAFGVFMWELFSLGQSPYPGMPLGELCDMLRGGYRMKQPNLAPEDIYNIMLKCWHSDPQQRPAFSALSHELGDCLEEGVVENYLKLIDPILGRNKADMGMDNLTDLPLPSSSVQTSRGPLPPVPVTDTKF